MAMKVWLAIGAFLTAAAVIAGAFGAHALASRLDAASLTLWETAARYAIYGGLATMVVSLGALHARGSAVPGLVAAAPWCLVPGALIFSGTVGALALGAPRWLGAVTPLGGALMIVGLVLFGFGALAL